MKNFTLEMIAVTTNGQRLIAKFPDWDAVERWFTEVFTVGGNLILHIEKSLEQGVRSLEIRSESGKYLLIAGFFEGRPIRWRRILGNNENKNDTVDIGGDEWDVGSVLCDMGVAKDALREIF